MYFRALGFAVYSQIIFNTHIIITSSESVAGFIKGLLESFWIKCGISESEAMSRLYVQTGPCQQVGSGWGFGGLILVLFLSRDLELVLGKVGPFWDERAYWPPCPYLPLTPTTHSCPTLRFSFMQTHTPSNWGITAGKKLSNGNLGRRRNVLYVQRLMF